MNVLKKIMIPLLIATLGIGVASAQAVVVDLCNFPETMAVVPNGTVLDDQWRSIGILFDVTPPSVDPIKHDFGGPTCHLFFSPDQYGVNAIFNFVEPGTSNPVTAISFILDGWYNPGESAQLVGLDSSYNIVAQDTVTPADIGEGSQTLRMSISGNFHSVEWRTQGNPGIAASYIEFELATASPTRPIPTLSEWGMIIMSLILAGSAVWMIRRRQVA